MGEMPPAFTKLEKFLANIIQPAMPSPETQVLLEENAKKWLASTILTLGDHYRQAFPTLMEELYALPPDDWQDSFQLACKWARRDLGRRLKQATCEVLEYLVDIWPASRDDPIATLEQPVSLGDLQPSSLIQGDEHDTMTTMAMAQTVMSPHSQPNIPDPEIEP